MATFHLSIKSGKKGKAANHAAYIAREGKHARDEEESDLKASVSGNMPDWADGKPLTFWKKADENERANGAAYREYELALPSELSLEQNTKLMEDFIAKHVGNKPYQSAIHVPTAAIGGVAQPHAHVMVSDRLPDGIDRLPEQHFRRYNSANPEAGGCKKDSGGKNRLEMRAQAISLREDWANLQNAHLAKHGHDERVDHRSHKVRGIDRNPERHLGHVGIKNMSAEEMKDLKTARLQCKAGIDHASNPEAMM